MAHDDRLSPGASFAVGSLPHRRAADAVDFSWRATTIPTIPSLPRRSPSELMVAQALIGIDGVSLGQYGGINVDVARLDLDGPIETDLFHEAFGGFTTFLSSVVEHPSPSVVKWQFVGPVTLGAVLVRVGLETGLAFQLALKVVRSHMRVLEDMIARACPNATQIIVLDEPMAHEAFSPDFAIPVDDVLDVISGALAVVDDDNWSGLHCCARTDWNALLSTGAQVLSVPVPNPSQTDEVADLLSSARRISEHLVLGGRVAWGAVRTDGPIASSPERAWKNLREMWGSLIDHGVDADLLREHSFVTPVCGLGNHSEALAEQVFAHVEVLSTRLAEYGVQ